MIAYVKEFYKKHNLRPVNATWLAYIHIMGSLGLLWMLYNYDKFLQVKLYKYLRSLALFLLLD